MSLSAMPFLLQNLGADMLYILDQRLKAQSIPDDKSSKVLHDVIRTMYEPKFISELMKPQELYSHRSIREVFDRLAHSSIMRLNEASMDKLYDLMVMGFKYQLVCCLRPQELLEVTQRHADGIKSIISEAAVVKLVDDAMSQINQRFAKLSGGDWAFLRQTLCAFFQDRRVKVSMFLQEGLQSSEGHIVQPPPTSTSEEPVGTVRVFDQAGVLSETENLELAAGSQTGAPEDHHPLPLGCNLYDKKRVPKLIVRPAVEEPSTSKDSSAKEWLPESKEGAKELNLLAQLLGPAAPSDNFKINLFPEAPSAGSSSGGVEILKFGATSTNRGSAPEIDEVFSALSTGDRNGASESKQDDGNDLLALMDRAK